MQQRALVLALAAAGTLFAAPARAADDCSQMFIYSVNQFCRTLSNGFSQCQPVGMVGPAPNCAKPGVPAIMPVPLAPPVTQAVPSYPFMPPFPVQAAVPQAAPPAPVTFAAAPVAAIPQVPGPVPAPTPATPAVTAMPTPTPVPLPVVVAPAATKPVIAPASPAAPVAAAAPPTAPAKAETPSAPPTPTVAAPAIPKPQPAPVTPASVTPSATPVVAAPAVSAAAPVSITLADGLAHFDFDRADLSAYGRAELDAWLKQPLPKGKSLKVTGHADRLGPADYNLKLSGRRAESVKKYLVEKGVSAGDIQVVAKGESVPLKHCKGGASKATIACLAPNRRVEIDP